MRKMNDAERYITRIADHARQTAAWRYYHWCAARNNVGGTLTDAPAVPDAVRTVIDRLMGS